MNWWGKVVGASIGMLAGPLSSLVGTAIGHLFDETNRPPSNAQKAKLYYLAHFFSCAAKIAKADGRISAHEINKAESLMDRMCENDRLKEFCISVFRKSKESTRPVSKDFAQVGKLVQFDSTVCHAFLGGLYEIAQSNGEKLHEKQIRLLLIGEQQLRLKKGTLRSWILGGYQPGHTLKPLQPPALSEAFAILGLTPGCTTEELKKCYRKKASEFHPDKIKPKELPPEFIEFANEQLSRINLAYDTITKSLLKS